MRGGRGLRTKSFVTLTLLSTFVLALVGATLINIGAAKPGTRIFVDPNTNSANINETFTININVAEVSKLYAWQFNLNWNATLLDVVSASEGPFLNSSGAYHSYSVFKLNFPVVGQMHAEATLLGEPTAPSGSGTIAYVTFRVKARGVSALDLYETILLNFFGTSVSHTVEDGYFTYPLPKIKFNPPTVRNATLTAGMTFVVDINISEVEHLYTWSLNMSWTAGVLNASSVTEGDFLKDQGDTSFIYNVNETAGYLYVNSTLTGEPIAGVDGEGVLVSITFTVKTVGSTSIDIIKSVLLQQNRAFIPHKVIGHGYFNNILRDIAITNIDVPSSVTAGTEVNVNVEIKNKGTVAENVTVNVNVTGTNYVKSLGTKSHKGLAANATVTLTFTWSTSGVAAGEYTVKAVTNVVPDEASTGDNSGTAIINVSAGLFGLPFEVVIGAIVGVVAVGGIVAFWFLRRGKSKATGS